MALKKLLEALCSALAAVALFAIMWLTLVDVSGRKFFSASLPGSLEVTELLMVVVIFAGLPLVSLRGEHVVFDSFDAFLPRWLLRMQQSLIDGLCAAALAGVAWLMAAKGSQMLEYGDKTQQLGLTLGYFVYLMSALIFVAAAVHVLLIGVAGVAPPSGRGQRRKPMTDALIGFGVIFALALLRVPLAFAMGFVGYVGLGLLRGWDATAAGAAQVVYDTGFAYTLSVVPLFILMGNFVARAGLANELFRAAYTFIGHVRGGLAHATMIACAGFGAICGSSIATAATMAKVACPSMQRHGYRRATCPPG